MKRILSAAALGLLLSSQAMADQVIPVNYSFDTATACGSWCYHDPSLTKLTDGIVGTAGWAHNQGQEWAGWVYQASINVTFNFATARNITSVSIGSTQDNLGDVALPSFDVWSFEGNQWLLKGSLNNPASSANDNDPYSAAQHPFYTLSNLNIQSNQVRVTARANGPWIFIDEVKFQASPVPEPETYAMMLAGLGVLAALARRRKA